MRKVLYPQGQFLDSPLTIIYNSSLYCQNMDFYTVHVHAPLGVGTFTRDLT